MKTPTAKMMSVMASVLSLTGGAQAFWRMPCRSRTGLARIDPIMTPGEVADHVHAIHGGNNLNMDTTPEELQSSDCTSCEVTQDKSAYWTPSLHFMYPNGTTVLVDQQGGMLAYYFLNPDLGNPNSKITAFPDGFQMISGEKTLRNFTGPVPDPAKSDWTADETTQFALSQKALGFNCLNYQIAGEGSLYRHFMPDKDYLDANCLDGVRLELMFPSCWNGKDLDSPDHKSHVAFPDTVMDGTCPEGFPVKLPGLFFETIWNTYAFAGVDGQFVLSHGDPTGFGYHGDFMMGWDTDFLQQAVDTCTNLSGLIQDCPLFDIQSSDVAAQCQIEVPEAIKDDYPEGPRDGLAIDIPIQSGPAPATKYSVILADNATQMPTTAASASASAVTQRTTAVVPTLTYSPANTATTDVTTEANVASPSPSSYAAAMTSSASSAAASLTLNLKQDYVAPTTASASLVGTPSTGNAKIIATSYMTQANEVLEVVIEQLIITVTATEPVVAKVRRHMDGHSQRRVERKERWAK